MTYEKRNVRVYSPTMHACGTLVHVRNTRERRPTDSGDIVAPRITIDTDGDEHLSDRGRGLVQAIYDTGDSDTFHVVIDVFAEHDPDRVADVAEGVDVIEVQAHIRRTNETLLTSGWELAETQHLCEFTIFWRRRPGVALNTPIQDLTTDQVWPELTSLTDVDNGATPEFVHPLHGVADNPELQA